MFFFVFKATAIQRLCSKGIEPLAKKQEKSTVISSLCLRNLHLQVHARNLSSSQVFNYIFCFEIVKVLIISFGDECFNHFCVDFLIFRLGD